MFQSITVGFLFFIFAFTCSAAVFELKTTVGTTTKTQTFNTFDEVTNAFKKENIALLFPAYDDTKDLVDLKLDFRGLPMDLTYALNGTTLTLNIPSIGVNQSFTGTTRNDSESKFTSWLKSDGGSTLDKIMKKLVEVSPVDPLAGNPNSLMGQMVGGDFSRAQSMGADLSTGTGVNIFGVGAKIGLFKQGGMDVKSLTIPVSYTIRLDSNPKKQILFALPLTYFQVEKAKSFNVSLSIAYRHPLKDNWALVPSIGTGIIGSLDLASVGQVASGSLTSHYTWKFEKWSLGLSNMVGYYQTLKVKVSNFSSNPAIKSIVVRNGLLATIPHKIFKWKNETECFIMDTRYYGTKLYMEHYNEIGFSMGSEKNQEGYLKLLRFGASYLFSSDTKGVTFNMGYTF